MPDKELRYNQLQLLVEKYIASDLSRPEFNELLSLVRENIDEKELAKAMKTFWEQAKQNSSKDETDWDAMLDRMMDETRQETLVVPIEAKHPKKRISISQIAVAASILLVVGLGSYIFFFNKPAKQTEIVKTQEERFKNDVNPGGYKARLTLADGRMIVLDSVLAGELAKQGGTVVLNKDGQLVYDAKNKTGEVLYNTLSTARGETYATVLADGSKVWLNSASSIKYPVAFVGNERKVEITGEAYFEVAKDLTKPFSVSVNGMDVQVLGTHFNINAYSDEAAIQTTLLEGSVKVIKGDKNIVIKPGEQANLKASGELSILNNADLEQVMAWKNGIFQFENADVASVMRQISRWYNVDIVYEKPVTKKISLLNLPRTVTMTNILKIMEMTGNVKFEIEGNKVTVMP